MVFGGWALFTGVSHILAARRAKVEDTYRGPMTTMGGVVTVVGLISLIWPGTGVIAISWILARPHRPELDSSQSRTCARADD